MKKKRFFSVLLLAYLVPHLALADEWQDPETKVNYYYTVGSDEASVGQSRDVVGDIAILSNFTVDGNEYVVTTIDGYAFYGCSGLTNVTIPESVTSIRYDAFHGCSGLANVIIPESVTTIEDAAFAGCEGLTSINIPLNVTTIGENAFADCSGLSSFTIPLSVTQIGRDAFLGTAWWESQPDGLTYHDGWLLGCKDYGPSGHVGIAEGTRGIAEAVFEHSDLTSITIPSSVSRICRGAFEGCLNLTSVTISAGVTTIDERAFIYCKNLTSVSIPSSVTSIGGLAFGDCSSLTGVTIPSSVTNIGYGVFSGTAWWESQPDGPVYHDGWLLGYKGRLSDHIVIADGTKRIAGGAFSSCNDLTNVIIPSSVTAIGDGAFSDCGYLTNVTISEGVTSIGERAFADCYSLASVTIPSSVITIGDEAFYDCRFLTSLIISEGVSGIGDGVFSYCSRLASVSIPSSVTTISNNAFEGCSGLTSVTIPSSVTNIGTLAFSGCSELANLIISEGVNIIGSGAFYRCRKLNSVTIPSSVTTIGNCSFLGCNGLNSVTILDGVTTIGNNAFAGCEGLTSVTIPETITAIGNRAFYGCSGLKNVSIPSNVTTIGNGAFAGCTRLKSISVNADNTMYDSRDNCNAIIETSTNRLISGCVNTIIPSSVTTIGDNAFYACSLTSVIIPSNVTSICDYAFYDCPLTSVTSLIHEPFTIDESVFKTFTGSSYSRATLYVPRGTKTKYEVTAGWKEFKNIVEMQSVEPIQIETTISMSTLNGQDLINNIVEEVYYNVGTEGYDSSDGSVVINQPTDMSQITDATPGSNEIASNFNGLILKVAAGIGTIKVNAKTTGNAQLVVQVGSQTPMIATKTVQGDVVVSYDVVDDTYVYIYATIGSSAAPAQRAAATDAVKIYSVTVSPGATGIEAVHSPQSTADIYYTLDGHRLQGEPTEKGVYIVNGRKFVVK